MEGRSAAQSVIALATHTQSHTDDLALKAAQGCQFFFPASAAWNLLKKGSDVLFQLLNRRGKPFST